MNASQLIDKQIADLADWRGRLFAKLRRLIKSADPGLIEDWKWNTAVWTHGGMVCAVGAFRDHVKVNFFKGAYLKDSQGLFNAGMEAKATRAIDFREGDKIDELALKNLVRAGVAHNHKALGGLKVRGMNTVGPS
ncbi:MAG TPA: DUF1801 domain-containing protein [Pyrinomonadaceae bacterium]|nr:DUF1801 domain-containing protein [Pyrinomonadaceae bacterium]